MHDIVERTCEVITTDSVVVYNPSPVFENSFTNEQFHPHICGKPATESVEYPEGKVFMCMEHWLAATNEGNNKLLESTTVVHWKVFTEPDNDSQADSIL